MKVKPPPKETKKERKKKAKKKATAASVKKKQVSTHQLSSEHVEKEASRTIQLRSGRTIEKGNDGGAKQDQDERDAKQKKAARIAKQNKDRHDAKQKKKEWDAANISTEQAAALTWPKCPGQCKNCLTTHVAIPGCPLSETCVRISLSVQNAPVAAGEDVEHQSVLIPIDKYELSVLGWLIWSTYVHQQTLRNATAGVLPSTKFEKDCISINTTRNDHTGRPRIVHVRHDTKETFQAWWEAGRNLVKWSGRRWLLIMFSWNMGDVDVTDATFESMGHLFTLPKSKVQEAGQGRFTMSQNMKLLRRTEGDLSIGGPDENSGRDDRYGKTTIAEERPVKEVVKIDEGKEGTRATEVLRREHRGPIDDGDPVFYAHREQSSPSSEESSQGEDDDFP